MEGRPSRPVGRIQPLPQLGVARYADNHQRGPPARGKPRWPTHPRHSVTTRLLGTPNHASVTVDLVLDNSPRPTPRCPTRIWAMAGERHCMFKGRRAAATRPCASCLMTAQGACVPGHPVSASTCSQHYWGPFNGTPQKLIRGRRKGSQRFGRLSGWKGAPASSEAGRSLRSAVSPEPCGRSRPITPMAASGAGRL